jgi:hypothetical protein
MVTTPSDRDGDQELPRVNKPLHGPERSKVGPAVIVIGILALVVLLFLVITVVRYNT